MIKGYTDVESIEGSLRYKLGIIDFLTTYDTSKYLENKFKSTVHHVDSIKVSAIDPISYQTRFVEFMDKHL